MLSTAAFDAQYMTLLLMAVTAAIEEMLTTRAAPPRRISAQTIYWLRVSNARRQEELIENAIS
jgi:hypothetical protein